MTIKEFLLELVAKCRLFDVNVKNEIKVDNITFSFGQSKTIKLSDTKADSVSVSFEKAEDGRVYPTVNGVPLDSLPDSERARTDLLDYRRSPFTRADLVESQVELLNTKQQHDVIIKRCGDILKTERATDIAAMVSAAVLIRIEDEQEWEDRWRRIRHNFVVRFGVRGRMIYNLFRSEILEREITPLLGSPALSYVEKIEKWDSFLIKGYPTAYFVPSGEDRALFVAEMDWRFNQGHNEVSVFSRNKGRNERVLSRSQEYAESHGLRYRTERYDLGFTPAIRVRIYTR